MPIVTTDQPGCKEVIRDGWNGYVTPCRNPQALAKRILDLLDDRATAARMGALGPDVIKSTFSLDKVVDQHAELYERLLRKRRLTNLNEQKFGGRLGNSSDPLLSVDGLDDKLPSRRTSVEMERNHAKNFQEAHSRRRPVI